MNGVTKAIISTVLVPDRILFREVFDFNDNVRHLSKCAFLNDVCEDAFGLSEIQNGGDEEKTRQEDRSKKPWPREVRLSRQDRPSEAVDNRSHRIHGVQEKPLFSELLPH